MIDPVVVVALCVGLTAVVVGPELGKFTRALAAVEKRLEPPPAAPPRTSERDPR